MVLDVLEHVMDVVDVLDVVEHVIQLVKDVMDALVHALGHVQIVQLRVRTLCKILYVLTV